MEELRNWERPCRQEGAGWGGSGREVFVAPTREGDGAGLQRGTGRRLRVFVPQFLNSSISQFWEADMRLPILFLLLGVALFGAEPKEIERVKEAATTFDEIMGIKEKTIPQELLDRAECVVIVPGLKKAAFIFGAKYGKGVISCRPENGEGWSGPSTVRVEGGSFGLQLGGSETDVVMLVMNKRGV